MRTSARLFLAVLCAVAADPTRAAFVHGQSLTGSVLEAETGRPIPDARVTLRDSSGSLVRQVRADTAGGFLIAVTRPGRYLVEANHDAFAAMGPAPVEIGAGDVVAIELRLSRSVIRIEPLIVTGRRADARHDGSYEGALQRRRLYPRLGTRRVMVPTDVELYTAMRVSDALRQLRRTGACMIMYANGHLVLSDGAIDGWLESAAMYVDALEFYRSYTDAPQSYRNFPSYVSSPHSCSVVALWTMQEPRPPRGRSWVRLLAAVGIALAVLFLGT